MTHRNVWEAPLDILKLRPNIENQICNAFKESRGQKLATPITIMTSDGERFVQQIHSLRWIGPATLGIAGVILRSSDQWVGGEEVNIELDLRAQQRNGELTVLSRLR